MINKKNNFFLLEKIFLYLGIDNKKDFIPFLSKWFLLSLIIHIVIAIFSTGFYHWDEHYQILEFLSTKIYGSSENDLPWEYRLQMRSWTQPGIYFLIAKFLSVFGLDNPISYAFFFRLFTSLIGWIALCSLGISLFFLFKEDIKRKWAVIFLTLTWYIPFIQTRASSEGLGTNVFILGLSMMIWGLMKYQKQKKFPLILALACGIFFGLSFTFRFQMGFVILFSWLWAVFIGKIPRIKAFYIVAGIIAMILMEVLVDFWGYGIWTFAPWNYIWGNLHLMDTQKEMLSPFMYPWWNYLLFSFVKGIPPISLLLIISQLLYWFKKPLNLLTWATLPLFIIHTVISIKDMRYMFPIALLTPLTLIELPTLLKMEIYLKKKWVKEILRGIFIFNIILLIIVTFKPVRPIIGFYDYVYKNKEKINKIYLHGFYMNIKNKNGKVKNQYVISTHPYSLVVSLAVNFYKPKNLEVIPSRAYKKEKEFWYFMDNLDGKISEMKENKLFIDNYRCNLKYLNYPLSLLKFGIVKNKGQRWVWGLFYCELQ